jgi:O-antigen ligase
LLVVLIAGAVWRLAPWREPVIAAGFALLGYVALRLLAEGWGPQSGEVLNHYHELLMIPLLWALLRLADRPELLMRGLFAGAGAFAALQWLGPLDPQLTSWLLARRISGSFALAVSAFLLFELGRVGALPRRWSWPAALFLSITVLFGISGRTGHVVLLVLLACAGWRAAPPRWRAACALAVLLAVAAAASLSTAVQERMQETLSALSANELGLMHDSPTGVRIELLRGALSVAWENFPAGTGWQAYPQASREAAAAHHGGEPPEGTHGANPHNEYLLQLGAGGLPALALFLLWLVLPMARGLGRAGQPWAGALGCVALAFATGCLFNSLLLDFTEGHVYGTVLAALLAQRHRT